MNKQQLFTDINQKMAFSEEEFEKIAAYFEPVIVAKKQKLVSADKRNDKIYFVQKGLLCAYKMLEDGRMQVLQFAKEKHWTSDLYSFFSSSPALFSVEALEDSELLCLKKEHFDILCETYPKMERLFRLQFQQAYVNTLKRLSDVYTEDAESKYNHFMATQNDLVQRVPQYLIASYLGVLPSSLSRIRNKQHKKI